MLFRRVKNLIDTDDGLIVEVFWKVLPDSGHTLQPLSRVYADPPGLFMKLLARKSTPPNFVVNARSILHL